MAFAAIHKKYNIRYNTKKITFATTHSK